jgi:hypothetical protein
MWILSWFKRLFGASDSPGTGKHDNKSRQGCCVVYQPTTDLSEGLSVKLADDSSGTAIEQPVDAQDDRGMKSVHPELRDVSQEVLSRKLLNLVFGDQSRAAALIQYEKSRMDGLSERAYVAYAIERLWEDRRR